MGWSPHLKPCLDILSPHFSEFWMPSTGFQNPCCPNSLSAVNTPIWALVLSLYLFFRCWYLSTKSRVICWVYGSQGYPCYFVDSWESGHRKGKNQTEPPSSHLESTLTYPLTVGFQVTARKKEPFEHFLRVWPGSKCSAHINSSNLFPILGINTF